jgi:hypothetical protein
MHEQKIVVVAGQRFEVPAATDNEAIRQQLLSMGFADVANAQIQTGTDADSGKTTIEFVKRAGTKGSDALIALLRTIPPRAGSAQAGQAQLHHLFAGLLTFGDVLDDAELLTQLATLDDGNMQGHPLCSALDDMPAIAARTERVVW